MLQKISIQNYAIIDSLEMELSEKLNIITGETGAGKSIIAGALGLILGERADTTVLVNKERKCVVEGVFNARGSKHVKRFLEENEFDVEEELVIRREIGTNGKTRAFVNDTPINLTQLNELSSHLVDLHQQFDTLELGQTEFQREVLDALAAHAPLLENYQAVFTRWQAQKHSYETLKHQKSQFDKEYDYHHFQFKELDEAGFRENELEELESEAKMLSHSEGIRSVLSKLYFELKESEAPIVQQLKIQYNQLQNQASHHPDLAALAQRIQSSQIELQDIADETERISNHINHDPQRVETINERLSLGYKLQKKHGVKSTNELLAIRNELEGKLKAVLDIDDKLIELEKAIAETHLQATTLAVKISEGRKKQAKPLEEKVNKLLVQVGMPNSKLKVEISDCDLNINGQDEISFLFDANKSGQFKPVNKVASGGELSRLMLCIKSLVAESLDLPTMIFDEIDTGISGEAAKQVGIILKGLTRKRQVICITHQPQIAGKADAHFFVYKEIMKNNVQTTIRRLNTDERITTIAKMLSGEKPTAAAIANAKEMIGN